MDTLTWYVARASGIVAWALVLATIVWGLLLATKVLGRRPSPAWLLSLHRYLGGLTVAFVGVHVGAVLLDTYTSFGPTDVLVPLTGSWHPVAVAWGIVAMYLLLAVEITSLLRTRIPRSAVLAVHFASFGLYMIATVHAFAAGTDAWSLAFIGAATLSLVAV